MNLVYPDLGHFTIDVADTKLSINIQTRSANLTENHDPLTFVGKRQRRLEGSLSVALLLTGESLSTAIAGLTLYKDEQRSMKSSYSTCGTPSSCSPST